MKFWLLSPLLAAGQLVATVGVGGPAISRYPGYNGPLDITGSISISYNAENEYQFEIELAGGAANETHKVHIHSGVTCASGSLVGNHFWAPFPDVDPWNAVEVDADQEGMISDSFPVSFGYEADQFIGHALVIHDSANVRVACGIIADAVNNAVPQYESATLTPYPGYTGPLNPAGIIEIWDLDSDTQVVNFRLTGLEANVTGGVHVHVGKTCETSGVHFWTPANQPDPWNNVDTAYTSNGAGVAEGSFKIASGYLLADNIHHAVVVHQNNGSRIACGLLGGAEPSAEPTAQPSTSAAPSAAPTTAHPTVAQPTAAPSECPAEAIEAVFGACKVYDFTGLTCTKTCANSLTSLVAAFKSANADLTEARACIDTVNATWVNGDLASLKQALKLDGTAICTVASVTNSAMAMGAGVLALLLPVFFL